MGCSLAGGVQVGLWGAAFTSEQSGWSSWAFGEQPLHMPAWAYHQAGQSAYTQPTSLPFTQACLAYHQAGQSTYTQPTSLPGQPLSVCKEE